MSRVEIPERGCWNVEFTYEGERGNHLTGRYTIEANSADEAIERARQVAAWGPRGGMAYRELEHPVAHRLHDADSDHRSGDRWYSTMFPLYDANRSRES